MFPDLMIGHHFSISALWYAPSASCRLLLTRRDHLTQIFEPPAHGRIAERIHGDAWKLMNDVLRRALRHP